MKEGARTMWVAGFTAGDKVTSSVQRFRAKKITLKRFERHLPENQVQNRVLAFSHVPYRGTSLIKNSDPRTLR